jgi:hypothetical protein
MSADASASPDASASQTGGEDDGIVREISLEEFDPVGTLAVNGAYFLLLLVLYALMYFVEFAGRSPSIIE